MAKLFRDTDQEKVENSITVVDQSKEVLEFAKERHKLTSQYLRVERENWSCNFESLKCSFQDPCLFTKALEGKTFQLVMALNSIKFAILHSKLDLLTPEEERKNTERLFENLFQCVASGGYLVIDATTYSFCPKAIKNKVGLEQRSSPSVEVIILQKKGTQ